ncbi:AAA family ATPase [Actinoplanes sp. L3-i22]|uniref:ATP-binding protein n=1 Tax=Actinoplanes sp. L3-i22 TaxID=2836373 RepID=UPI001C77594A|nr:LuxR family transcriptional regulator [Actinoplanes sp. L3-i22]BCY07256.1 LuxR family transcriptional regulator [Actinoplanes sp. L3-i22]
MNTDADRPVALIGRDDECRALDELIGSVRAGHSRALVLLGEPGIGKSALLEHLTNKADDVRVLRATGIRAESELPFAGLHQMFGSMIERIDGLPAPRRTALRVAFGIEDGARPDRYVVALAVLNLVGDLAQPGPVLCLVDDEQWLDRPTVLALSFVARRMSAGAAGFVFASAGGTAELDGLPALTVSGLSARHAGELLDSALTGPLDPSVRHQIVAETRGNPSALLDLPRGVGPAALAGGFRFPGAMPLPRGAEAGYRDRLAALNPPARQFLLLAAAEPVGDATTLWAAAARLGLELTAATDALACGLVMIGARVEFRHPLARTAVYRAASLAQRREAHDALGAVTDPGSAPDRRAWHRAYAATGPDEVTADELERSADQARSRGGLAASAAFLERSAALTVDMRARVRRLLAAAEATRDSGSLETALGLVESAGSALLGDEDLARILRIRGLVGLEQYRRAEGVGLLLKAAAGFRATNRAAAVEAGLEALVGALSDAEPDDALIARTAAAVAELADRPADPPTVTDLLLRGLHRRVTVGYPAAAPVLRQAVQALVAARPSDRWSAFGAFRLILMLPAELMDERAWGVLVARQVAACRRDGALGVLPAALNFAAYQRVYEGDFFAAEALLGEANSVAAVTTGRSNAHTELIVSAWRGEEARTRELGGQVRASIAAGRGAFGFCADYADALLANGLGRFDVALPAARRVFRADQIPLGPAVAAELMDAAARTGATDDLRDVRDRLAERLACGPGPWLSGLHERSLALLAGDDAEHHFRESVRHLGETRGRLELARSHLMFGEWLRRRGRRGDARRHLREAHQSFRTLGAAAFAGRAARELSATGDAGARAAEEQRAELTAQEAQIARLAGDGLTNPEIGARLFISPRTVQYHLRKVFLKLGIMSRSQLRQALLAPAS